MNQPSFDDAHSAFRPLLDGKPIDRNPREFTITFVDPKPDDKKLFKFLDVYVAGASYVTGTSIEHTDRIDLVENWRVSSYHAQYFIQASLRLQRSHVMDDYPALDLNHHDPFDDVIRDSYPHLGRLYADCKRVLHDCDIPGFVKFSCAWPAFVGRKVLNWPRIDDRRCNWVYHNWRSLAFQFSLLGFDGFFCPRFDAVPDDDQHYPHAHLRRRDLPATSKAFSDPLFDIACAGVAEDYYFRDRTFRRFTPEIRMDIWTEWGHHRKGDQLSMAACWREPKFAVLKCREYLTRYDAKLKCINVCMAKADHGKPVLGFGVFYPSLGPTICARGGELAMDISIPEEPGELVDYCYGDRLVDGFCPKNCPCVLRPPTPENSLPRDDDSIGLSYMIRLCCRKIPFEGWPKPLGGLGCQSRPVLQDPAFDLLRDAARLATYQDEQRKLYMQMHQVEDDSWGPPGIWDTAVTYANPDWINNFALDIFGVPLSHSSRFEDFVRARVGKILNLLACGHFWVDKLFGEFWCHYQTTFNTALGTSIAVGPFVGLKRRGASVEDRMAFFESVLDDWCVTCGRRLPFDRAGIMPRTDILKDDCPTIGLCCTSRIRLPPARPRARRAPFKETDMEGEDIDHYECGAYLYHKRLGAGGMTYCAASYDSDYWDHARDFRYWPMIDHPFVNTALRWGRVVLPLHEDVMALILNRNDYAIDYDFGPDDTEDEEARLVLAAREYAEWLEDMGREHRAFITMNPRRRPLCGECCVCLRLKSANRFDN
jgi:hypothetical protein